MSDELLNCPFCGGEAGIVHSEEQFQIVGCLNFRNGATSMLCPNPKIIVYKSDSGEWDYRWWNRRTIVGQLP